ncbi:MAG: translocation/assembly module TamB domain-containing protein [Oligoflexia bacterium]|nr:translocation/assembly module TamB domain-containing protein [Oligoflexia bacterium]
MRKRPFLFFMTAVTLLVSGAIWFIQSPRFAIILKEIAAKHVPSDLGIAADFREINVKLFPPGLSLRDPVIELKERNILKLPRGSSVRAERLDLNFRPFQMLSGNIRVHETVIVNGEVRLFLDQSLAKKRGPQPRQGRGMKLGFHWDELLQVRTEAIAVQNTRLRVEWTDSGDSVGFLARSLRLGQWSGQGGLGYEIALEITALEGSLVRQMPLAGMLGEVKALAHTNAMGVQLESFSLKGEGIEASASGTIQGDILNPKGLRMEATARANGRLERIAALLAKPSAAEAPAFGGLAEFTGKVHGNLERPLESLRAEGDLEIRDAFFREWKADRVAAKGAWSSSPSGGELSLKRAEIEARETEGRPAGGGKITVGAFRIDLAQPRQVTVPLLFERAHIHWLGAPALKDVYPLLFRVSGPVEATFVPGRRWNLLAKTKLEVLDFQLDNQRLGKLKPLRKVLQIPRIGIDGTLAFDPTGFRPQNVLLSLPKSRFRVGGKMDFKAGFDLRASGNAHLEEVGRIAEVEIRGEGNLDVHVHGPSSRVRIDFDADIQKAEYLNLQLGALKGRITWDDDPSRLLFEQVRLMHEKTIFAANGVVDAGEGESIDLKVKFQEGDIRDLLRVFDRLVAPLWWFPRSLNGAMRGDLRVFGGLDMKELQVQGGIEGSSWEYLGERFAQVALSGGYDKGRYHLGDFRATKSTGKLEGKISYDDSDRIEWELRTQGLAVSDIDHVGRLDVPIRGKLVIDSKGSGRLGQIRSSTQISGTEVAVRGGAMPPSQLSIRSEAGRLEMKGTALGGQGLIDLSYDFTPAASSYFRAEMKHLDFSPILLLLNPQTIPDPAVAGFVSGSVNLSFRSGAIERSTGAIAITEYLLAKTGTAFRLAEAVSFRVNDGSFEVADLSIKGNHGNASLSLRGSRGEIEGAVIGTLDVSIAEFLTSSISQAKGLANLDFLIGGALKAPEISGRALVDAVSFRVPAVDSPFENVTGALQLRQNVIRVQGLEGDLAGGRISAEGLISLFTDRFPSIDLKAVISGPRVKVFPFQYAKVRGTVGVRGEQLPYAVEGSVVVDSALSREKVFQQKYTQALKTAQYTPPPTARRLSDYPWFRLGIDVRSDGGILVQNDLFDVDLKAQIKLVNTLDAPRVVGNVDLVQGRMIFKDRTFQIQSAAAIFDNPTVINPRFTMTANTEVNGVKVQAYASGRMDKWKLELSSNPVMPESEIISLLALGLTSSETKRLSSADRTVFEQGEAASLLLHSLDFNREVESKTGLQIQFDETVNSNQGTSIFRPQSESQSAAAPKIVIRKQLTKNVDISAGSTVGVGTGSQKEVNAEVQIVPGLSVIGVYDNYETTGANPIQSSSYGFDLKVQKRFR